MDRCGCMKCHTTNRSFSSFFSPNSTPISNWWFTLADQKGLVVWLFGFGCSFLFFLTDKSNRVATDCVNHIANVSFYVSLFFFCFLTFFFTCMFSRSAAEWHTNGQFGTGRPLAGWMLREWPFFLLFRSCPTKSSIMVFIYMVGTLESALRGRSFLSCVSTTIDIQYVVLLLQLTNNKGKSPPQSPRWR